MATPAQLAAAFKDARAWIDKEAGIYATMIPDADVRQICQVIVSAVEKTAPQPSLTENSK